MYDSDMAKYLKTPRIEFEENITLLKRWAHRRKVKPCGSSFMVRKFRDHDPMRASDMAAGQVSPAIS
jgi:hypothetical protein